jgi:hypothetical protein
VYAGGGWVGTLGGAMVVVGVEGVLVAERMASARLRMDWV